MLLHLIARDMTSLLILRDKCYAFNAANFQCLSQLFQLNSKCEPQKGKNKIDEVFCLYKLCPDLETGLEGKLEFAALDNDVGEVH